MQSLAASLARRLLCNPAYLSSCRRSEKRNACGPGLGNIHQVPFFHHIACSCFEVRRSYRRGSFVERFEPRRRRYRGDSPGGSDGRVQPSRRQSAAFQACIDCRHGRCRGHLLKLPDAVGERDRAAESRRRQRPGGHRVVDQSDGAEPPGAGLLACLGQSTAQQRQPDCAHCGDQLVWLRDAEPGRPRPRKSGLSPRA